MMFTFFQASFSASPSIPIMIVCSFFAIHRMTGWPLFSRQTKVVLTLTDVSVASLQDSSCDLRMSFQDEKIWISDLPYIDYYHCHYNIWARLVTWWLAPGEWVGLSCVAAAVFSRSLHCADNGQVLLLEARCWPPWPAWLGMKRRHW